jgi:C4-dicarboxylate-specific signal transduction histidine kinase
MSTRDKINTFEGQMPFIEADDAVKAAEEALRGAQAERANVNDATTMGQLAASIAHEINQPLSGMITNADAGLQPLLGVRGLTRI